MLGAMRAATAFTVALPLQLCISNAEWACQFLTRLTAINLPIFPESTTRRRALQGSRNLQMEETT